MRCLRRLRENAVTLLRYALLSLLIGAGILGAYRLNPPAPLPDDAPPQEFSAYRALNHVAATAIAPHRTRTAANAKVRDYILDTLAGMGVQGEVISGTTVGMGGFGEPEDIIARLPGTNPTKAFMLCAHYDSVPFGPGAADDLSGVATMLETCRALQAGPRLRNDVVFLFDDAEERGLLGAYLFRDQGRCAGIGLMLNIEARGTCGPSCLFETSEENGWLLPEVIRSVPHPRLNPLIYDIYLQTPFKSDFAVLKSEIPGMNMAFLDGIARYHTRNDCTDNLDPGSLQHHGSYALSLARHFGGVDLTAIPKAPEAVAVTLFGDIALRHPQRWQTWLLGVIAALSAIAAWSGLRHGSMTKTGLVRALLAWFGITLLCLLLMGGLVTLAFLHQWFYMLYSMTGYTLGGYLAITGLSLLLAWRMRHEKNPLEMVLGCCGMGAVVAVVLWGYFPHSACLVEWPLVSALTGIVAVSLQPFTPRRGMRRLVILTLAAVPGVLIIPQTLFVIHQGMPMAGLPVGAVFCVLLTGLLCPSLEEALGERTRHLARIIITAGLVLVATDVLREGRSADGPRMDCLSYAFNHDTGQALWVSTDAEPDRWTAQFFPKTPPRKKLPEFLFNDTFMIAPAPAVSMAPPVVEVVADVKEGAERRLTLRYRPGPEASRARLRAELSGQFRDVAVNGKKLSFTPTQWDLDYTCLAQAPVTIELAAQPADAPITMKVAEVNYALPSVPDMPIRPRPSYIIEENNTVNGDRPFECGTTLAAKRFVF